MTRLRHSYTNFAVNFADLHTTNAQRSLCDEVKRNWQKGDNDLSDSAPFVVSTDGKPQKVRHLGNLISEMPEAFSHAAYRSQTGQSDTWAVCTFDPSGNFKVQILAVQPRK